MFFSKRLLWIPAAAAVASTLNVVEAQQTIDLDWTITQYDPMTASVGDSVVFTYQAFHDVFRNPNGECEDPNGVMLADVNDSPFT